MPTYQILKIFISSPGDVDREREYAEKVIANVNESCKDSLGLYLDCDNWKNLPALTPTNTETIQGMINEYIMQCNIFLLILNKRLGSEEPNIKKSRMEIEIDIAIKKRIEDRRFMILSYFRNIPHDNDRVIKR